MWLYEKHGIWIVVNLDLIGRWYYDTYTIKDGLERTITNYQQ